MCAQHEQLSREMEVLKTAAAVEVAKLRDQVRQLQREKERLQEDRDWWQTQSKLNLAAAAAAVRMSAAFDPSKSFQSQLQRLDRHHFDRIEVGRFDLSIQASSTHYCTPRKDGLSPSEYESFEVAVFEEGRWLRLRTDPRFDGLAAAARWETGLNYPVGACVSVAEIDALIARLVELASEGRS